jgi:hypothetical protein
MPIRARLPRLQRGSFVYNFSANRFSNRVRHLHSLLTVKPIHSAVLEASEALHRSVKIYTYFCSPPWVFESSLLDRRDLSVHDDETQVSKDSHVILKLLKMCVLVGHLLLEFQELQSNIVNSAVLHFHTQNYRPSLAHVGGWHNPHLPSHAC